MLCKVISTKSVYGDKEKILELVMTDKEREHFIYRVFGAIEAHQIGKGKHKRVDKDTGEAVDTFWTKFYGEFYAVNEAGREFEAATMFLPDYVSGQFVTQLSDNETHAIEFAYDVFAVYSKESITSYEFVAQPVKRGTEESAAQKLAAQLPALPNASGAVKKIAHKKT